MVRAKFCVQKIERMNYTKRGEDGVYRACEMQTVVLSPVTDGTPEDKKFWDASPSGEIRLGTINMDAAHYFHLGKKYYIDFTEAPEAQ